MISKQTKIQTISVDENKRILAVSDIHGEVTYLDGVLKKAEYSTDDILVIVGDMIEKGRESLKTVRYILELKSKNPNIYVTMGNVDLYRLSLFYDESKEGCEEFISGLYWTRDVWKRGFFLDILDEMGIALEELCEENIAEIKRKMEEAYHKELDFIWNLPTILVMDEYIFVHGGIPTDSLEELEGEDAFQYMKIDAFMDTNVKFTQNVVVGHWPTCLYHNDIYCMNPIFDYKKHIIGIDGGCALKRCGGQLNALIIPSAKADLHEVTYVAYDDYPIVIAKKAQRAKESTIGIRYLDCEVRILNEKEGIAGLQLVSSGKEFKAPSALLYRRDNKLFCDDYNDTYLEIRGGDRLSVLAETPMGMLVKKDGYIGWYNDK